jgi:hypothetical protein
LVSEVVRELAMRVNMLIWWKQEYEEDAQDSFQGSDHFTLTDEKNAAGRTGTFDFEGGNVYFETCFSTS